MVEQNIQKILSEVLGLVTSEEVNLNADLVRDLGAESIDFIDICFRIEQEYRIPKVNPGDMFPTFLQSEDYLDDQGNIKDTVRERLVSEYPHVEGSLLDAFIDSKDRRQFVTVNNIVRFVEHRLAN